MERAVSPEERPPRLPITRGGSGLRLRAGGGFPDPVVARRGDTRPDAALVELRPGPGSDEALMRGRSQVTVAWSVR